MTDQQPELQKPTTQRQLRKLHPKFPWNRSVDLPHGKAITVSHLVDEYLKSDRYLGVSIGAKNRYLSALRLFEHLVMANGKTIFQMKVHLIDYGIVDYMQRLMRHAYEGATIRLSFTVLANVWDVGLRNGRVNVNPWLKPHISVRNERDITWKYADVRKAVECAREMGFNLLALYLVMMYETAQRPWKDLRDLTWENIHQDTDGSRILDFVISKTKTHLMIPLSQVACLALDNTPKVSKFIFAGENGEVLTRQCISRQFDIVKKTCMLNPELQFRDLRRTAVTEMVQNGATGEEIKAVTGWRDGNGIIHRYARIRFLTAKNAMDKRDKSRYQEPHIERENTE